MSFRGRGAAGGASEQRQCLHTKAEAHSLLFDEPKMARAFRPSRDIEEDDNMLSIHGKVLGLAVVMAALGTGCAVDSVSDVELDEAGLDEVEQVDSTAEALEGDEATRGGFQQAPSKAPLGPSKGGLGQQAPFGLQGPADLGQAPIGLQGPADLGQAPVGVQGPAGPGLQAPIGQVGQAPIGQAPIGQGPMGVPGVGAPGLPGVGLPGVGVPGLGLGMPGLGFGAGGFGALGSRFGGFGGFGCCPINIINNNIFIDDRFRDFCHFPPHCCDRFDGFNGFNGCNNFGDFANDRFDRFNDCRPPFFPNRFCPCFPHRPCGGGNNNWGWGGGSGFGC
ncbi:hypothetical protein BE21_46310 [Sorangium cellulosum]|uniref:Uncharacterized protein n=1 Tax=Sorangium cellulosum TaxID=56 RepID=A0A150TIJ6_SORCE|nr:hypothetical protein BE21_46310 [Sorangium cellulosum]